MVSLRFIPLVGLLPASANKVVSLDLFRATEADKVDAWELANNNLADMGGVLKYIHTEIVVESELAQIRENRKYDISVIATWPFKVLNPDSLLAPSTDGGHASNVDFGPFTAYDVGKSTETVNDKYFEQYGDYVGIQSQTDVRTKVPFPSFWFSVSGFCPNKEFGDKGNLTRPNPECLKYNTTGTHKDHFVGGGRCGAPKPSAPAAPTDAPADVPADNTTDDPAFRGRRLGGAGLGLVEPTGEPGCVYSYGESSQKSIDELVGITQVDCGDQTCTDWKDFRDNCVEAEYKKSFYEDKHNGAEIPEAKATDFCVEYDIHPHCARNCEDPRCKELIAQGAVIEVGLPFWQGRCDMQRNRWRTEKLRNTFGLGETHSLSPLKAGEKGGVCAAENAPNDNCRNFNEHCGIGFCDRSFSGVCAKCKIPGTECAGGGPEGWCPFGIFQNVDYQDKSPVCKTAAPKSAREQCCFYKGTCDGMDLEPDSLPLDDDGLAHARYRAWENTDGKYVVDFLKRVVAAEHSEVLDSPGFDAAADNEWGVQPTFRTLEVTLASLRNSGLVSGATTTTTTTTMEPLTEPPAVTEASTEPPPVTEASTEPPPVTEASTEPPPVTEASTEPPAVASSTEPPAVTEASTEPPAVASSTEAPAEASSASSTEGTMVEGALMLVVDDVAGFAEDATVRTALQEALASTLGKGVESSWIVIADVSVATRHLGRALSAAPTAGTVRVDFEIRVPPGRTPPAVSSASLEFVMEAIHTALKERDVAFAVTGVTVVDVAEHGRQESSTDAPEPSMSPTEKDSAATESPPDESTPVPTTDAHEAGAGDQDAPADGSVSAAVYVFMQVTAISVAGIAVFFACGQVHQDPVPGAARAATGAPGADVELANRT